MNFDILLQLDRVIVCLLMLSDDDRNLFTELTRAGHAVPLGARASHW